MTDEKKPTFRALALDSDEVFVLVRLLQKLDGSAESISTRILERLALPAMALSDNMIEQLLLDRLVRDCLTAGYEIEVINRGEGQTALETGRDRAAIVQAIATGEVETDQWGLHLYRDGAAHGWIWLLTGNGLSLVGDYTDNLEDVVAGVTALADMIEEGMA